jgi:hypothetical protein
MWNFAILVEVIESLPVLKLGHKGYVGELAKKTVMENNDLIILG